jgi:hypothetical protein
MEVISRFAVYLFRTLRLPLISAGFRERQQGKNEAHTAIVGKNIIV